MPGETATLASWMRSLENSSEPRLLHGSGIGASTNIVPLGLGTDQPSLLRPSTSTLRRLRWTSTICSTHFWSPSRGTMLAIWMCWDAAESRYDLMRSSACTIFALPHTKPMRQPAMLYDFEVEKTSTPTSFAPGVCKNDGGW